MRTLRLLAMVWCGAAMQTAAVLGDVLGKAELAQQAKDAAEHKARRSESQGSTMRKPSWFDEALQVREE